MDKATLERAIQERYSKEMIEKIKASHVGIAGLGGLGSNIAVMLARSGVGHLTLVDFDVVDVTNLNRQMYMISHIGKPKAEALKEIIDQINPYLDCEYKQVKVTSENIESIFFKCEILCEAFDKPDQKAMLVQEALTQLKNTIVVSGNGMAGYSDANEIKTRKLMERLYVCGDEKSGIEDGYGLMAPRVALCAAHQANKVIELIMKK